MSHKDKINRIKRVFDEHNIKRTNYENEFFEDLIQAVESTDAKTPIQKMVIEESDDLNYKNIRSEKMELMINIDGICNNLKGKTRLNRYSFGLDIRKLPLTIFLTETKLLVRNRDFKKSDIVIFYDDTRLRTGNRGFSITRDEVITNISGLFRVLKFQDMDHEPEFVVGHKKDAFRIHIEGKNFDIKVNKKVTYTSVVFDVLKLLYKYANIIKKENENLSKVKQNK